MNEVRMSFRGALKGGEPRKNGGVAAPQPAAVPTPLPPPVSRAARQLALAHLIERKIEAGELKDYADAARRLRLTPARLTQIVDLVLIPVREQEAVLLS